MGGNLNSAPIVDLQPSLALVEKALQDEADLFDESERLELIGAGIHCIESLEGIECLEKIAAGGFAEVYKVNILHQQGLFAGKKMLASRSQLARNVWKFKNELLTMARLKSSGCDRVVNCVAFLFDVKSREYWIIMEYLEKGDLHSIINEKKELDEKSLMIRNDFSMKVKIAHNIAKSMMDIHEKTPFAHLDIKSLNILLDENLECKIADFCDAKVVNTLLPNHMTPFEPHGTIYWMAPECIKSNKFNQKSDIYGLSIVFSELLILSKPYPGMNVLDVKEKIEKQHGTPYRMNIVDIMKKANMEVTEHVIQFISIIEDMWKDEAEHRPTARQVVERLDHLLERLQ